MDKATVKILDLGCGTGMIGKNLSEQGFKNISLFAIISARQMTREAHVPIEDQRSCSVTPKNGFMS